MEIVLETDNRPTKTILLRLSPDIYSQCDSLAKQARRPLAAVIRLIVEGALAQGVRVAAPATK